MIEDVKKYLADGFGGMDVGGKVGLPDSMPLVVKAGYRFSRCRIAGTDCILAEAAANATHTPRRVQKQLAMVGDVFGMPVVFATRRLQPHERERYLALRIPIVVPGKLAYLPFAGMMQDTTHRDYAINRESLSPLAQLLVIGSLEHRLDIPLRAHSAAGTLGCSATAVQNAFRELEYFALGERTRMSGTIEFIFAAEGRELWDKARPVLGTPVRKVVGLAEPPPDGCVVAGVDALAALGRLNMAPPTEYATAISGFSKRGIEVVSARGAPYRLQLWAYAPCRLGGGQIDTLSLLLSLSGEKDDRVRGEIDRLLKEFKW